ncbi:MAG: PAS domain-containing protein [Elusimicrobia bacterium]|nr:PAS domain-containing protein [Elusimicrobiota bacterium]
MEFLKPLVDSLSEGVLAVDRARRVVLANPALSGLLNRPPLDAIGKPLWEVLRHRELGELVDGAMAGGPGGTRELGFGTGPERTFLVRASPLRSEGKTDGAVLTFSDISHLRRLENLRKEFVANVSHELKTPLTALRAALETLLDGALEDPAHAREFLETAQEQAERLQRLIEDLLALSLLERPGVAPQRAACSLHTIVARVLKTLEPLARKENVSLSADLPPSPLDIDVDADELMQILMNLVDNGIKFNRPGGRVTLRATREEGNARIEVEDSGTGISPEDQPRVFERFFRADKARTSQKGGTGLGLAIVKHIVENRGASVTVASVPGQGSVFTVRLPMPRP